MNKQTFTDYQEWDSARRDLKGDHYAYFSVCDTEQFAWWNNEAGEGFIISITTLKLQKP